MLSSAANGYVIADGMRLVPTSASSTPGGLFYVHNDHLGTPQVITDSNQAVVWKADYDPFGKATVTTETITNNVRFPGQYFDGETGLHYNYFRYYDPGTGRYVTSDPIGLAGGLNSYGYVGGNPVIFVDPFGLVVSVCTRPINVDWVPNMLSPSLPSHTWVKTDTYESGMGGECPTPGQQCSDLPYSSTETKDHSQQSSQENASCEVQNNVDEQCVNNLIKPGQKTGIWSIYNQCQSFSYSVINRCRYGAQIIP